MGGAQCGAPWLEPIAECLGIGGQELPLRNGLPGLIAPAHGGSASDRDRPSDGRGRGVVAVTLRRGAAMYRFVLLPLGRRAEAIVPQTGSDLVTVLAPTVTVQNSR